MSELKDVRALTFDLFGTVLDLGGSLMPPLGEFLRQKGAQAAVDKVWQDWRYRQRIEQHQDTIMMLGHSGYLETARRACVYTLKLNHIEATAAEVAVLMEAWQDLSPFPEVKAALERLKGRYQLVALSNGEPWFLEHLAKDRIGFDFTRIISVEIVGRFKPHPSVYRRAALELGLEVGQCLMVSSNSFDVVGARACGFQAAYVNRQGLPYDDSTFKPQLEVKDFTGLADALL